MTRDGVRVRSLALVLLVVVAVTPVARPPAAAQLRPLALSDYGMLVGIGAVVVSPDGSRTLFEASRVDLEGDERVREVLEVGEDGVARRLVGDASRPRISPSGDRVAVLRDGQVWMVPLRGGEPWQATSLPEPVTEFAWSPDGERLVVVSRDPRRPAPPLVPVSVRSALAVGADPAEDGLQPGEWIPASGQESPAAEAAAPGAAVGVPPMPPVEEVAAADASAVAAGEPERPLPRVIRRLQFKADGEGHLPQRWSHLYLVELSGAGGEHEVRRLTAGEWDDSAPVWSPDGRWIAFVSERGPAPDRSDDTDIWLLPLEGDPVRLTETPGAEAAPVFSPDGRWLAYRHTPADPPVYAQAELRMVGLYGPDTEEPPPTVGAELAPTETIALTAELDRPVVSAPVWRADGTAIYVTIQDRGTVPLLRVGTGLEPIGARSGGLFRRRPRADVEDRGRVGVVVSGPRVVGSFALRPMDEDADDPAVVFAMTEATAPAEIHEATATPTGAEVPMLTASAHIQPTIAPTSAALRRLTSVNAPLSDGLLLARPEPLRYASDPEVLVEGWLLRPAGRSDAGGLPLIVSIHGGPVEQFTWAFDFYHQWLAAQGYAVLYLNPRGSSGYGLAFAHALWADWGGPDLRDVVAGLDHLHERRLIDPRRVGVVGWSYGGILTNYLITRTDRFAAAVSGASETDNLAAYGVDDLQLWWEDELGLPYDPEARAVYERLSAIHDVTEIDAPTLFIVGELDVRVPAAQSEQMYQQLRRRLLDGGPETALVVYPGEFHLPERPSFDLDYFQRTKAWFDRFVLGDETADPWFGSRSW